MWTLLLLAATVRSFAHIPLGLPIATQCAVTRMWRSCHVQPSQKERAVGAVRWKRRDILTISPLALRWMCNSPRTGCAPSTTPIYMWREQAMTEWSRWVISIVACCHSVKLCALAARAFPSQHMHCKVCARNPGGKQGMWSRNWNFGPGIGTFFARAPKWFGPLRTENHCISCILTTALQMRCRGIICLVNRGRVQKRPDLHTNKKIMYT